MDTGERAAVWANDKRAELIARRVAELLRDLDAVEFRLDRLETLLLTLEDCADA